MDKVFGQPLHIQSSPKETLTNIQKIRMIEDALEREIKPAAGSRSDLPYLNEFGDGFLHGYNTNPYNRIDGQSWSGYLQHTYRPVPKGGEQGS